MSFCVHACAVLVSCSFMHVWDFVYSFVVHVSCAYGSPSHFLHVHEGATIGYVSLLAVNGGFLLVSHASVHLSYMGLVAYNDHLKHERLLHYE